MADATGHLLGRTVGPLAAQELALYRRASIGGGVRGVRNPNSRPFPRLILDRAFVEGELEAPRHLDRRAHNLYFDPQPEEFRPRTDCAQPAFSDVLSKGESMEDQNAPATLGHLQQLEARLEGRLDTSEQRILDSVREMVHDSETRLLGAFYTFAESNQKRLTENERDTSGLKDRMAIMESRITEIEKRLNMPPAA